MIQKSFAIVEAPSVLGLFPKGVERLPDALLAAGLAEQLGARRAGRDTCQGGHALTSRVALATRSDTASHLRAPPACCCGDQGPKGRGHCPFGLSGPSALSASLLLAALRAPRRRGLRWQWPTLRGLRRLGLVVALTCGASVRVTAASTRPVQQPEHAAGDGSSHKQGDDDGNDQHVTTSWLHTVPRLRASTPRPSVRPLRSAVSFAVRDTGYAYE
jgi:hypothetical protein